MACVYVCVCVLCGPSVELLGYHLGASGLWCFCCHVTEWTDRGLGEWQREEPGIGGVPAREGLTIGDGNMLRTLEGSHQGSNLLSFGHLGRIKHAESCRGYIACAPHVCV